MSESPLERLPGTRKVNVLIVDDSIVVRSTLSAWLSEADFVGSVFTAADGFAALAAINRVQPDIVVLDLEMPRMDGIEALPLIRRLSPRTAVLVSSNMTPRGAALAVRCLELGAADVMPKPSSERSMGAPDEYRRVLIERLRLLSHPAGQRPSRPSLPNPLRIVSTGGADAIVIGASTGGPQALVDLLGELAHRGVEAPIVIAQHMPAAFASVLADHLRKRTGLTLVEAVDGAPLACGCVTLSPGGCNVTLEQGRGAVITRVTAAASDSELRPSVDQLFQSASTVYGARLIAVVLSGMGADGLKGARAVVARGGAVYAQDRQSSAVWGMPGVVASAGIATDVLSPVAIARRLGEILDNGATR